MLPMMETDLQKTGNKKSYSKAVSNKQETVFIMKPVEENDARFSEMRKRDIKIKIDVSKIGVGITKMKRVTRGAAVVGCENKAQAEILKEKITSDLGEKYVIQTPSRKKWKIRIFDVDKEEYEKEQEFWEKIEEQNGFTKNSIQRKIVHKLVNGRFQRTTIIAEVDVKTHKAMVEEKKSKNRMEYM